MMNYHDLSACAAARFELSGYRDMYLTTNGLS